VKLSDVKLSADVRESIHPSMHLSIGWMDGLMDGWMDGWINTTNFNFNIASFNFNTSQCNLVASKKIKYLKEVYILTLMPAHAEASKTDDFASFFFFT